MNTRKLRSVGILVLGATALSGCGGFGSFGSSIQKNFIVIKPRVPYTHVVSYFGFVKPGSEPDAVVDNKKFYYLYLWIPAIAPEIGVRMVSPVKDLATPKEGDFISPLWEKGSEDMESYFDTYITFEKAPLIQTLDLIKAKKDTILKEKWEKLASNDDSSEMPKQPSGRSYNSLLRVTDKSKLLRGLYRIGFTTYKRGEVQGTFLAQIGAPIKLPGVVLSKDIDGLIKAMEGPTPAPAPAAGGGGEGGK